MIIAAQNREERLTLLTHLAHSIGETPQALVGAMPFAMFGIVKDNRILGAICFLNYRRESIEFHLCGSPGWLSRREIGDLFAYPFLTLKCRRLWCLIRQSNKEARLGAMRLGFRVLGVAEDEFGEGEDGVLFSMKRSDCKWLRKGNSHG